MPVRLTMMLVAVVATVLAVAGCGGDDASGDSPSTEVTTSSLTKAQYIKQADEACSAERAKLVRRMEAWGKENGPAIDAEGTPKYADAVEAVFLPMFEDEVVAVQALGAPAGEEEQIEAMLAGKQEAIEDVADEGVETFDEVEQTFGEVDKMASDYGLTVCNVGVPQES